MVRGAPADHAGAMTENMTEPPRQEPGPDAPPPRWHSENLTDYRALRRSRADRKVAGVAGGLGSHLNIDPTILRVLFVVLTLFGGSGVLLYGALWLLVPEEHTEEAVAAVSESTRNALLIGAGVIALLLALGETWTGYWLGWPLAVLGLVAAVVLLTRDRAAAPAQPPPPPYAGAMPPPYQGATPPPAAPVEPRRPRHTGPLLFGITLALVALALGVLGLFHASGADVADAAYPALALGVVGVMLVVGAFRGRPGGLIALGLVSALLLAAFSIGNPTFDGDRDARITPERAADVADSYDVPAGRIVLDLTEVADVAALHGRSIELSANAGELVVILPDDLAANFDASIDYGGSIETPSLARDGWSTQVQGRAGDEEPLAVVDLELDLQFGHIEVVEQ